MKVLFTTNIPSPYRVDFFNQLGKLCDLTVVYERNRSSARNAKWHGSGAQNYREIYLSGIETGEAEAISFGIIKHVADRSYDKIIIGMYSSPTSMIAIEYMRLHKIPFYISTDGGFIKQEPSLLKSLKKHFISSADYWFSPGDKATEYLIYYGADKKRVGKYPFTSLSEQDMNNASTILSSFSKQDLRNKLNISESHVLLSVGRFSYQGGYGKGYDTLMHAAKALDPSIGIYIVGDEPTDEFLSWKLFHHLDHVHFIGFKTRDELAKYYAMADAFILLTRGDVWGLVINEAMSFSLPVITTKQCLAGAELVKDGVNGFLIDAGDISGAVHSIQNVFSSRESLAQMGSASRETIESYTIENMATSYYRFLVSNPEKH